MTLPDFTAENTLYQTSGHYRAAGAYDQSNGAIYPAQSNKARWTINGPIRLQCSPMTFCNPDPLNPFCENCTVIDENCSGSTYQYCTGVKIPNKIPINIPDPVVGLARRSR